MNRIFKTLSILAVLTAAVSCKGTWLMYDTSQTPTIYFEESLQTHLFSFALIPDDDIVATQSIYVMGMPASHDREYAIEYIPAEEGQTFKAGTTELPVVTARPGIDFDLGPLVIPAGQVEGTVTVTFHRQPEMIDTCALVKFRLKANENFVPCATDSTSTQRILTPEFVYYVSDGEPSCPSWWKASSKSAPGWDYDWGKFYPQKFRRLLQYLRDTKETCPSFYDYVVTNYGENLDNPDAPMKFWRKSYMSAWAKYIAYPLFLYYQEYYKEHPDDPNFEYVGTEYVNINSQIGWGNPMYGTYGFFN